MNDDDYAYRFQYADGSAFQIYADGTAYIMAKDGSIRDKPKGEVTNRIPALIGSVAKPRQDRIDTLAKALQDLVDAARNEAIDARVMRQATYALDGTHAQRAPMRESGEAVIEDGSIVIRVALEALPMILEGAWAMNKLDTHYKITDASEFAKELMHALNREDEQGTTPIHELFDGAILHVIEQGGFGIDEESTLTSTPGQAIENTDGGAS